MIFILPLTFERGKSSNFIQTKTEYMRKLIPLAYLSAFILCSACATYRTGQMPDDVYMAANPEIVSRVDLNQNKIIYNDISDNGSIRVQTGSRLFSDLNNFFCDEPRRLIILNNQCYCVTDVGMFPFVPARPIKNMPIIQNNPSVISKETAPRTIQYGKYATPEYQNGSRFFPKANNRNDIQYQSSENNGGSRYFQNNTSSTPSGNGGSSGSGSGARSGRRN